jgi:hypothetical protein
MSSVVRLGRPSKVEVDLSAVPREVSEEDARIYKELVSTELTSEQVRQVEQPPRTYERQLSVVAVHWHQEFVPPSTSVPGSSACSRIARPS